jgi:hypothetical protein
MATTMVQQPTPTINPILPVLATALKLELTADAAGQRAVDRALEHLAAGAVYDFDGTELRVTSYSRRHTGMIHVTDGLGCTCESAHRPWCRHRALFRLLLAALALQSPITLPGTRLRVQVIAQHDPHLSQEQYAAKLAAWNDGLF